eukprot:SAG22_NODE_7274_length_755_cov_1.461890_1_plen_52_part_00
MQDSGKRLLQTDETEKTGGGGMPEADQGGDTAGRPDVLKTTNKNDRNCYVP